MEPLCAVHALSCALLRVLRMPRQSWARPNQHGSQPDCADPLKLTLFSSQVSSGRAGLSAAIGRRQGWRKRAQVPSRVRRLNLYGHALAEERGP